MAKWPLTGNLPEPKTPPFLSFYDGKQGQLRAWREAMNDPTREPQPAPYPLMPLDEAQVVMRKLGRKTLPIGHHG